MVFFFGFGGWLSYVCVSRWVYVCASGSVCVCVCASMSEHLSTIFRKLLCPAGGGCCGNADTTLDSGFEVRWRWVILLPELGVRTSVCRHLAN